MRMARLAVPVGSVGAGLALTLLAAAPASAYANHTVYSERSSKGGYGTANAFLTGEFFWLRVCDKGTADGYRAVGRLSKNGTSWSATRHAAGGSGSCVGGSEDGVTSGFLPQPFEGTYTLSVCLRNGASGADFACTDTTFYFDGSA
ncbi:hypothetical protein ACGF07_34365 [Kitasatospora sp. NPDC048194]|uniref:hypothetical protein n=1 Tax=Kitasatospora sp. NPDC048194 TaxID=3364045 RepID=UPI00370FC461